MYNNAIGVKMKVGFNTCVTNNSVYNASFRGLSCKKVCKNIGIAAAAATLLTAASCSSKNNTPSGSEIAAQKDSALSVNTNLQNPQRVKKNYYYFPTEDGSITSEGYDWSELVFPNGKIIRDSLGYKIYIEPNGDRTVIHSTTDDMGHKITTTEHPNGTKIRTDYNVPDSNEILYTEKNFRKNGTIIDNRYYNEIQDTINNTKTIEQSFEKYNENDVLLYWESNVRDSARNESFNKYDSFGRLVYDDIKNEKFIYEGKKKTPKMSIARYENCKRYTLYNPDGSINKVYFKASDGTITPQDSISKDSLLFNSSF